MKFNKTIFIVSLLACSAGFTACDNDDDYVPGAPAGEYNIGFESESSYVLGLQDTEISVELTRDNAEGELTVPLQHVTVPNFVTVPESATFADGSATTSITMTIGEGMKPFTTYWISVRVPEQYNTFYNEDSQCPILNISVRKEDYEVVANSIYQDPVFYQDQWNQPVEYSALKGLYRLPDCFAAGAHWYFTFDGENFSFTDNSGTPVSKFLSGYVHPSYGAVTANVLDVEMGYDEEGPEGTVGYFYFPLEFTVSAVSFGDGYEYLFITEWIKKPWETEAAE